MPCDLRLVGDKFYRQGYGYALQQNSPFTDSISNALLQMVEQGLVKDAYDKWLYIWPFFSQKYSLRLPKMYYYSRVTLKTECPTENSVQTRATMVDDIKGDEFD